MTIPKGVTVRQIGETPPTRDVTKNFLWQLAQESDVVTVVRLIHSCLGISPDSSLIRIYLEPDMPHHWSRNEPSMRLQKLGEWLKAECFELMDLVEVPAISTIGD